MKKLIFSLLLILIFTYKGQVNAETVESMKFENDTKAILVENGVQIPLTEEELNKYLKNQVSIEDGSKTYIINEYDDVFKKDDSKLKNLGPWTAFNKTSENSRYFYWNLTKSATPTYHTIYGKLIEYFYSTIAGVRKVKVDQPIEINGYCDGLYLLKDAYKK